MSKGEQEGKWGWAGQGAVCLARRGPSAHLWQPMEDKGAAVVHRVRADEVGRADEHALAVALEEHLVRARLGVPLERVAAPADEGGVDLERAEHLDALRQVERAALRLARQRRLVAGLGVQLVGAAVVVGARLRRANAHKQ